MDRTCQPTNTANGPRVGPEFVRAGRDFVAWPPRISGFALALLLLVCSGCGREREPVELDMTRTQLVWDLWGALGNADSKQALRHIERLRAVSAPSPFFALAEQRERLRQAVGEIHEQLVQGEVERAQAAAQRLARHHPDQPLIEELLAQCKGLVSLRAAALELPCAWASEQDRALAPLLEHVQPLSKSPVFRQWYAHQQAVRRHLYRRERAEGVRQLRSELDAALVSRRETAPLVLAQLAAVDPAAQSALQSYAAGNDRTDTEYPPAPLSVAFSLLSVRNTPSLVESKVVRVQDNWRSERLRSLLARAQHRQWNEVFREFARFASASPLDEVYVEALAASFAAPLRKGRVGLSEYAACPSVPEVLEAIVDVVE
jgi:hypothetical protein